VQVETKPDSWFAAKTAASSLVHLREWLRMRSALLAAQAEDESHQAGRRHNLSMACAHADVADSLLKAWKQAPLLPVLTLCREALLWSLSLDDEGKRALSAAVEASPQSLQAAAEHDDLRAARLRHLLAIHKQQGPDQASPQEQEQLARLTIAAVRGLQDQVNVKAGPAQRRVMRTRRKRWALAAAILLGALLVLSGLARWALWPRDLAAGKPWHTSSTLQARYQAPILFHTNEELNPWLEIDLLHPIYFHRVIVKNRPECCWERAIPLILEVSDDQSRWDELDRRDASFSTWEANFPPVRARYVRLRVLRFSILHLERVQVY
jgi:hypothetical protein